mmetsp:Transcript_9945/g.14992  ORF Transcript_9945/g.14992 Transcript_9945/m.14992 type:complete len:491 (+) Transcript_9945:151-1623(+)|eukprot:CAMPEP_0185020430 /NCGR_PEP_ID=MMETSP1103-20130426/3038_1 /TAXON_ID=36769 /ORGANISM="Paraphysomonas bandaiensis, Strain Caron Lab Isolate" /LENGTH=490 /DNA_ID=CAMNT_0027551327 /DNA_START=81 /DNA_END=1553 /DNA_ORIENTATION=-
MATTCVEALSSAAFSIHRKRIGIKCGILTIICVLYIYLKVRSDQTNNWESVREYCFSESEQCKARNAIYGVVGSNEAYEASPPLCYRRDSYTGSDSNICYSDKRKVDCISDIWQNSGIVYLGDFYSSNHHNYFLYDMWILSFSIIILCLTVLFEATPASSFVSDEAFTSNRERANMLKISAGFGVATFAIMITSSQNFTLMKSVSCSQQNQDVDDDRTRMCLSIEYCGSEVRSIIFPKDVFVEHYMSLSLTLAMMLLVIVIYTLCFAENLDEDEMEQSHATNDLHDDDSDSFVYITRTLTGSIVRRRYTAPSDSRRTSRPPIASVDLLRQHTAFKRANEGVMRRWKFGHAVHAGDQEECAICLESLKKHQHLQHSDSSISDDPDVSPVNPPAGRSESSAPRGFFRSRSAVVPFTDTEALSEPQIRHVHSLSNGSLGRSIIYLPVKLPCGHRFHEVCICEWMRSHSTCPICRADLETGNVSPDNGNNIQTE